MEWTWNWWKVAIFVLGLLVWAFVIYTLVQVI